MRAVMPLVLALAASAFASDGVRTEAGGLVFSIPDRWERVRAASPLRAAQFRIPRERGDKDDGELILFLHGETKGGGAADNVERWYSQFTQPDGRPSKDAAVVSTRTVNGLDVKVIDVSGTFRPQMGPMEHRARPAYRLLGAVVEGEGGPWFLRAVGPAKTMAAARDGFDALVNSVAVRR